MAQVAYEGVPDAAPQPSAPQDYQDISANANEFGGLVGEAASRAGASAADALHFYDQVAADNSTNNTLDQVNKLLYGDPKKTVIGPDGQPTQDTGYLGLRGADAMKARPEVDRRLDEIIANQRENLPPGKAQLQFESDTRRYRAQWDREVGAHADQQQRTWTIDTNNTSAELALNALARNPNDPAAVAKTTQQVRTAYVRNAQLNGEDAGGAVLKADQSVAEMQISALLATDPIAAQEKLKENTGLLASTKNYDALSYRVNERANNAKAGNIADGIITNIAIPQAKAASQTGTGPSESEASDFLTKAFPGAKITSEQRTPQRNAEVGGVPTSMHVSGQAIDFVPPPGVTLAQVKAKLIAQGLPASELIDEKTHIHWGWGAKRGGAQDAPAPGSRQSYADHIRRNYSSYLDAADAQAEKEFPDDQRMQDIVHSKVERKLNDALRQQEIAYKADSDLLVRGMSGDLTKGHLPTSIEELTAISPQMKEAWENVQADNPTAAYAYETKLTKANSTGAAADYGSNFYKNLRSVLAEPTDNSYVHTSDKFLPFVATGPNAPLTNSGFSQLNQMLQIRGTPQGEAFAQSFRNFLDVAHNQISGSDPRTGVLDHAGDQQFGKYLQDLMPRVQAGLKAGQTPAQMFDPKSPDYVGSGIYNFTRPLAKRVQDMTNDSLTASMYGPKPVDPARVAAIDNAVKEKQLTAEQGASIKAVMQSLADKRITRKQAEQRIFIIAPELAPPPPVPTPSQ